MKTATRTFRQMEAALIRNWACECGETYTLKAAQRVIEFGCLKCGSKNVDPVQG